MAGTISDEVDKNNLLAFLEAEANLENENTNMLESLGELHSTYLRGYMKRQNLFACLSCGRVPSAPGGICDRCCRVAYHDGHSLVEMWTKRNFRCDCGNTLFYYDSRCCLQSNKDAINVMNRYNENSTCKQSSFESEDDVEECMLQCVVCEDWFYGRHLSAQQVGEVSHSDMVCSQCVTKHPFLRHCAGSLMDGTAEGSIEKMRHCHSAKHKEKDEVHSQTEPKIFGAIFLPNGWRALLCRCKLCMFAYENQQVKYLLDNEDSVEMYESEIPVDETCHLTGILVHNMAETHQVEKDQSFTKSGLFDKVFDSQAFGDNQNLATSSILNYLDRDQQVEDKNDLVSNASPMVISQDCKERVKYNQVHGGKVLFSNLKFRQRIEAMGEMTEEMQNYLTEYLKKFEENGTFPREEDVQEFWIDSEYRKRQKVE